jgi:hypothetical protein
VAAFALGADSQAPVTKRPGGRALDLPVGPPEPFGGFDAGTGDPGRWRLGGASGQVRMKMLYSAKKRW